ncbi:hypothetical protein ATO6_04080 [Oceanicola sp. 22II-s10i]|uniref:winged helix-turn-helix domain-containing protein n=1 Tax=Oceanicola sp. 22II-s10i TaxID=1317116 RepID=UPI000B52536B|nr:crosslink repair DNA glycosylase YcaQ family protein [Oceanicola sp. 22II-s10i]OWU86053.1 hypothetical protein ATO6_04080 [Oceanicola sp. 22II-s10i]
MAAPELDNTAARRIFLHRHLLGDAPAGPGKGDDLMEVIRGLGFVQVDSVNTVERAHHMILFARRPAYRPKHLKPLLERDRRLFEHWTHDASVIPTEFLPHWHLRYARNRDKMEAKWTRWQGDAFVSSLETVMEKVRELGAVRGGDLAEDGNAGNGGGWWNWHPSKTALEFLWHTGSLAVTRREGFAKVYDLAERVHPPHEPGEHAESIDWLNNAAMDRLGFATSGQIAAFWAHVTPSEAAEWCRAEEAAGRLEQIRVGAAGGGARAFYARPGLVEEAGAAAPVTGRLRILSPFDPAIRDRKRCEYLFGYHYRIEIFVPEAQRKYGYYVFPILEGDRLIGRIDMKALRDAGVLSVTRLWLEPGVKASKGRLAKLDAELARVARFAGVERVDYAPDWLD